MNGHVIPKWFLGIIAGTLSTYFVWSFGNWIENVNADILSMKYQMTDIKEEQLINFLWLADQLDDPIKGRELRNKLYDLRLNRK